MGSYWDTSIMDDEARDYFRDRLPDWPPIDYPEPGEFDDLDNFDPTEPTAPSWPDDDIKF